MPFDGTGFPAPTTEGFVPKYAGRLYRVLARIVRAPDEESVDVPPQEVAALLRNARALIEPERNWLRGHYYRTYSRFCAVGALRRAGRGVAPMVMARAHTLLLDVARQRGFETVERMNDHSTHTLVLSAFDQAIAASGA